MYPAPGSERHSAPPKNKGGFFLEEEHLKVATTVSEMWTIVEDEFQWQFSLQEFIPQTAYPHPKKKNLFIQVYSWLLLSKLEQWNQPVLSPDNECLGIMGI